MRLLSGSDVLAWVGEEPEGTMFEGGAGAARGGEAKTEHRLFVHKPADPVFSPAIGPAACVIVRKIFPGRAVLAVILAHRSPLPLAEIRPPAPPMFTVPYFLEAQSLGAAKCPAHTFSHRLSSLSNGTSC